MDFRHRGPTSRLAFGFLQHVLSMRRDRYLAPLINPKSNIADFGSGHSPYKHARTCVDKLDSGNIQRGGRPIIGKKHQVFRNVDLNIIPYPFGDLEFDFIICSHVLEHLADPVTACREISRVGKGGYIELPAFDSDIFMRRNDAIHKWLGLYDSSSATLFFMNRSFLVKTAHPSSMPLWLRFFLAFKVSRILWKGAIKSAYLSSESWPEGAASSIFDE